MSTRAQLLSACTALSLAACATQPEHAARTPIPTITWQLVSIQSMDDAQGTTWVADPARYTLTLQADGRAVLRLDCNRAHGTWQARSAGANSGMLEFGPLASTRAACPPPTLGPRIARDLPYVRGYLLRDGELYLSLMADGGIYRWRPAPQPD